MSKSRSLVNQLLKQSDLSSLPWQFSPFTSSVQQESSYAPIFRDDTDEAPIRLLLHGDNLAVLLTLVKDMQRNNKKIALIYIDPPFDSAADYYTKRELYDHHSQKATFSRRLAYEDNWECTLSYLEMLTPRLMLMRELLSEQGALYIHLDWHVGHYVKIILDDIFGKCNFRNEIVWQRDAVGKGAKKTSKQWSRELESIYVYSKSENMRFNQLYRQSNQLSYTQLKEFRYSEPDGRKFKIVTLGDYSSQSIEKLRAQQLIYTTSTGKEYKKYYLDQFQLAIGSLWNDISNLSHGRNRERLHFATQKPEKLLERIIEASTVKGDIVADFFCGSGTTAAVAEKLQRSWIVADIGQEAVTTTRKRLLHIPHHFMKLTPKLMPTILQGMQQEQLHQIFKQLNRSAAEIVEDAQRFRCICNEREVIIDKSGEPLSIEKLIDLLEDDVIKQQYDVIAASFSDELLSYVQQQEHLVNKLYLYTLQHNIQLPSSLDSYDQQSSCYMYYSLKSVTYPLIQVDIDPTEQVMLIQLKQYYIFSKLRYPSEQAFFDSVGTENWFSLIDYWGLFEERNGQYRCLQGLTRKGKAEGGFHGDSRELIVPMDSVQPGGELVVIVVDIFGHESHVSI